MPICPVHNLVQLTQSEVGESFWDCPIDDQRWLSQTWSLIPAQKSIISEPPSGFEKISNLFKTGERIYIEDTYTSSKDVIENHIPLIIFSTEVTF